MKLAAFIRKLVVRTPQESENEIVIPDNLFVACPGCQASLYNRKLSQAFNVCPHCGHHLPLGSQRYQELLGDRKSFMPLFAELSPKDSLAFPSYQEKLRATLRKEPGEAITTGRCSLEGHPYLLGIMNSTFFMGSLGSVAGEKITRLFEVGLREKLPVVLVIRSGGARMQEGVLSLMQMAKTAAAIERHSAAGLLYVALLTHPTTGGVSASFAMLGDITLAEPQALIGFAGPRVIEQTIRQQLPPGFQKAEYALSKGFVDAIVPRNEQRATLAKLLAMHGASRPGCHYSRPQTTPSHPLLQRIRQWFKIK